MLDASRGTSRPASSDWDVLIVGGGPAGASCASFLAQQGLSVLLCERERFPRFHVGESLLPHGNAYLERLGVLDACRRRGWMAKPGASFLFEEADDAFAGLGEGPQDEPGGPAGRGAPGVPEPLAFASIRFAEALDGAQPDTFQVPRAEFDALLLDRAAELGVVVRQRHAVREVTFDDDGVSAVLEDRDGKGTEQIRAGYLVDASGQCGFLAKRLGLRRPDDQLRNIASFSHFEGWRWPTRVAPGNIQVVSLRDLGWLWIVPLAEDRVSVGLVEPSERAARGAERETRLDEAIRSTAFLRCQSADARRVAPVRGVADFGYGASSYAGDRWLLVGDAGSFVDPVFSTGVLLALASASEAAEVIGRARGSSRRRRRRLMRRYGAVQLRRYRFFRRFVLHFYRPGMRDLLCQRRDLLQLPRALSSVLSGAWRLPWSVRWRLELFYLLARLQGRLPLVSRYHHRDPTGAGPGRESGEKALPV